jgi:hypothetical protein
LAKILIKKIFKKVLFIGLVVVVVGVGVVVGVVVVVGGGGVVSVIASKLYDPLTNRHMHCDVQLDIGILSR